MALFEIVDNKLHEVAQTTFSKEGVHERRDLQDMIKNNISIVAPDMLVLSEEYGNWEDSRRRIDLLGLDRSARLVVIELKRTEDGGHMDLQAIRYAAMVSKMTFSAAVKAHADFKGVSEADAEDTILEFLGWETAQDGKFGEDVRIFLISSEFSKEITTAAMWLSEYDIDISCIRLRPHKHAGKVLIDVQKIFPLPEAEDYQVRIREKEKEEREIRTHNRDFTRFDLYIKNGNDRETHSNLPKRELVYLVVREGIKKGYKPRDLVVYLKAWVFVDGVENEQGFIRKANGNRLPGSSNSSIDRFNTEDDRLFHVDGKTYALTTQWGRRSLPTVNDIISRCQLTHVEYREAADN